MSDQFWLTEAQLERIDPYFPKSRGVPRVDDRRVVSGIIHVIRNGLRWRNAPAVYGPHKTLYNRFVRWSRMGVFDRVFANLAAESGPPDRMMIESTHLKAHRTAASLLKKGILRVASVATYCRTQYQQRHRVENMFARLKDWRRISTRYDRCAHTFFSAICIAATVIFWLGK